MRLYVAHSQSFQLYQMTAWSVGTNKLMWILNYFINLKYRHIFVDVFLKICIYFYVCHVGSIDINKLLRCVA
ncbi:hypothetical protein PO909_029472 [Leuciscus waleckii]